MNDKIPILLNKTGQNIPIKNPKIAIVQLAFLKVKVLGAKLINENAKLSNLVKILKIPTKKVAIELNQEIMDKKKLNRINLKKNDKIEIVHFIGGG